jgi:hypothetical protein
MIDFKLATWRYCPVDRTRHFNAEFSPNEISKSQHISEATSVNSEGSDVQNVPNTGMQVQAIKRCQVSNALPSKLWHI